MEGEMEGDLCDEHEIFLRLAPEEQPPPLPECYNDSEAEEDEGYDNDEEIVWSDEKTNQQAGVQLTEDGKQVAEILVAT